MKRALAILLPLLCATPAFAWDLPQQLNTQALKVTGQGDKFGPSKPEAFSLPALLHTARLSAVGQGNKYGPSPAEAFSLPPLVKTKPLSVVGHP